MPRVVRTFHGNGSVRVDGRGWHERAALRSASVHGLILWCGFLGGWLLFAGPVYQAALELDEERRRGPDLAAIASKVAEPEHISPWWWLVPPLGYVLQRRRSRQYRDAFKATLSPGDLRTMVTYMHKANGWIFVAGGALLIATKETYELAENHHLPLWVFIVMVVVMAVLAASYTAVRLGAGRELLGENRRPSHRDP